MGSVTVLDYGAGNIRSLLNALRKHGYDAKFVEHPSDILQAEKLIFPGVGAFRQAIVSLEEKGYKKPLQEYIASGKPFLGICLGLQTLFEGSEESPGVSGLGVFPGTVRYLGNVSKDLVVPHMGWNQLELRKTSVVFTKDDGSSTGDDRFYFTHSFAILADETDRDAVLGTTFHGTSFVSVLQKGNVLATQFHPEKSGRAGLALIGRFLKSIPLDQSARPSDLPPAGRACQAQLARRVIACLDVRSNDAGDLVVTKGEQYDVRERTGTSERGEVRNLGKPVELARRYFQEGADEVVFLNITSFRNSPLHDQPMLEVLRRTSEHVFVPLCVGGGIRDLNVPDPEKGGEVRHYPAVEVATAYFRSGADKVSIGSDAVRAAEEYIKTGRLDGTSSIEAISTAYGRQAVVISVDPRRVYVKSPSDVPRDQHCIPTQHPGPNGETYCWFQCTTSGGRTSTDLGVYEMVRACEALGAGEIMLNSIDRDGTNSGYDLELIADVKSAVRIPVIASSGAGCPQHFVDAFKKSNADAALAAGIFHRQEVPISAVKDHLDACGVTVRGSAESVTS